MLKTPLDINSLPSVDAFSTIFKKSSTHSDMNQNCPKNFANVQRNS